jgi:PAS domain S-box-containing protein
MAPVSGEHMSEPRPVPNSALPAPDHPLWSGNGSNLWLLETLVEASHDGLTIETGTGTVLYLNARAAELAGAKREEFLGRNTAELVSAGYFDRSVGLEVIRTGLQVSMLQTVRDGRKLLVSGKPIHSPAGELEYIVVTDRDVTEFQGAMNRLEPEWACDLRRPPPSLVRRGGGTARLIIRSAKMQAVYDLAVRCAAADSPVLILGETGTGKGLFAGLIHRASSRAAGPFLELNCGSIADGLVEPELFGYARGAFTGASPKGKPGLVELADGGTLFLDEIGELPAASQTKLLQFLDTGEIRPVGGLMPRRTDVRVIAATNRNLVELVSRGGFRRDLYHRLNVLRIEIPPLRERPEDVPGLVEMMLSDLEQTSERRRQLSSTALKLLMQYGFPGNVRELWNLVERLVVTVDTEIVDEHQLSSELRRSEAAPSHPASVEWQEAVEHAELVVLRNALAQYPTQALVARHLGVSQATISRRMKRYGLR